jgi:Tol biopolymer transport system component
MLVLATAGAPAESPAGRIVFARFVGQHFELFKVRPDGSGLVRLTRNGFEDEAPRWSPDGRRLLTLVNGRLVIRSADGSAPRRLPATGHEADWSPDGRLIAYLIGSCEDPSGKLGDACADLWVIRPDGSGRRRLAAADVDLTLDSRPYAWAPGGRRLVYVKAGGPGALFIVRVRDGRKRTLSGTRRALSTDPAWSPDGRWIAFSRQRGPFQGSDLYAADPDGTKLRRLARGRGVSRAAWSPNGRRIAYLQSTGMVRGEERFAVVVADRDGSQARRLAVTTDDTVLLWSPDSSRVLWSTFYLRLTTARADGRGRPSLVTTGESPDWG